MDGEGSLLAQVRAERPAVVDLLRRAGDRHREIVSDLTLAVSVLALSKPEEFEPGTEDWNVLQEALRLATLYADPSAIEHLSIPEACERLREGLTR